MDSQKDSFIKLARHRFKFPLYLLKNIPSAFFSGVKVQYIDKQHSIVTIPLKWFSQNPFRSTYFACLAMAAEMSTGLLSMMCTYKRIPGISMLVIKVEGEFFKKATGLTSFICLEGKNISDTIDQCIATGQASTIRVLASGTNNKSEPIANFYFTWSFKKRSK